MKRTLSTFILTTLTLTVGSCSINKKDPTLVSIDVKDMTTVFEYDSSFTFDGKCVATYSNNTNKEVTPTRVSDVDTKISGEHTVEVYYTEKDKTCSTSYTVTVLNQVQEKTLDHIKVTEMSTTIKVGNSYVFDGICTAFYSDSSSEVVTPTSVSSIDTSTTGDYTVTVSYTYKDITKTDSFTLTVYEETAQKVLVSISVSNMSTQYNVGDAFSFDGICIAHFSNGDEERVTPTVVFVPDMSVAGDKTITLNYTYENITKQTTYNITVKIVEKKTLSSISVSGMSTKYEVGDTFSFDGTCTAHFSDGSTDVVTPIVETDPDMSVAGDKTITVSYTYDSVKVTTSYSITVSESEEPVDDGYITLDRRTIELKRISKTQVSLVVTFHDCESEDVTWTTSDENIATVRYGLVKSAQKNNGTAIITCTTESGKTATCVVTVVEEIVPKEERYVMVTDFDSLEAGDIVVIAAPEYNATASVDNLHMKLNPVTSSFSSDGSYITSLGEETAEFILNGEPGNFTMESQYNKYLASTHEGKVTSVNNKGNIHWDIHGNDYDDPTDVVIESEVESHGYFMYNIKQDYFTVYTSNIQEGLLILPKLYKLTYI